ncbi:S8 family peptidase [Oerskovia turbata]|nr:S8 family serine peptidase [Oerskovia turbata]
MERDFSDTQPKEYIPGRGCVVLPVNNPGGRVGVGRRCRRRRACVVLVSFLTVLTGCVGTRPAPTGDAPPVVAILDGGIDAEHPALDGVVEARWTLPRLESATSDHATSMAGLVAGHRTGPFGGGVAVGVRLLDVVVVGEQGTATASDLAAGLGWAVDRSADVVLISMALENDEPVLREAVAEAVDRGTVVVAANGNGIGSFDAFPAAYDGVLAITSHDAAGLRASLANGRGAWFSLPGHDVLAPVVGGGYETSSGTSVAAAVGAGTVASCWLPRIPRPDEPMPSGESVSFPDGPVPVLTCPGGDL